MEDDGRNIDESEEQLSHGSIGDADQNTDPLEETHVDLPHQDPPSDATSSKEASEEIDEDAEQGHWATSERTYETEEET